MPPLLLHCPFVPTVLLLVALCGPLAASAPGADTPAVVDDFAQADKTSRGAGRMVIDDAGAGSKSHATQRVADGVLVVEGELVPGRGAPAFISIPLLLRGDAAPQDVSAYAGVRLRVKINQGILTAQVATADVDNFDFHSAPVVAKRGEFTEVRVAFTDMKRAWSAQTALNSKLVTSVNLVAFGMAPGKFAFEVDEIGFY